MMKRIPLLLLALCALASPAHAAFVTLEAACETSTDTVSGAGGTLDLDGAHSDGYLDFATAGATNGDTFTCTLTNGSGASRLIENGICTYNTGTPNTVSRAPVASTTNGVSATGENFTSGIIVICNTPIADYFVGGVAGVSFLNVDVAGTTVPTNGIYEPSANVLGLAVNGASELTLSATALSPTTTDGLALGDSTHGFSDITLAAGAQISFLGVGATQTITDQGASLIFDSTATTSVLLIDGGSTGGLLWLSEADANGTLSAGFQAPTSLTNSRTCQLTDTDKMIPATCVGLTGAHFWYAAASCPSGSLTEDGSAVSRTTYAALFAVISTTWGAGDGSTTFNLPNLHSEANSYIRYGDGTTLTVGTVQADQILNHTHDYSRRDTDANTQSGTSSRPQPLGSYTTGNPNGSNGPENRPNSVVMKGCIWY